MTTPRFLPVYYTQCTCVTRFLPVAKIPTFFCASCFLYGLKYILIFTNIMCTFQLVAIKIYVFCHWHTLTLKGWSNLFWVKRRIHLWSWESKIWTGLNQLLNTWYKTKNKSIGIDTMFFGITSCNPLLLDIISYWRQVNINDNCHIPSYRNIEVIPYLISYVLREFTNRHFLSNSFYRSVNFVICIRCLTLKQLI